MPETSMKPWLCDFKGIGTAGLPCDRVFSFAAMGKPVNDSVRTGQEVEWSVVLPTYRRQETLRECLAELVKSDLSCFRAEVLVYDNGAPDLSERVVTQFLDVLPIRYTNNGGGNGLGYSLCRGAREARGRLILELNDDALVPADHFTKLTRLFDSDPKIGVIGVRAVETGYRRIGEGVGSFCESNLAVIGNFDVSTQHPIEVEHVYGFCYAYRRELMNKGVEHDQVLLAQDYSSGNRIETDHCLMATRFGYRVVYDGSIGVVHLAKPRPDMSEVSPRWRLNEIRNTLYLYLKHFGWLGRSGMAARYCLLHDLGLISMLKHPNRSNWIYFSTGLRGRASAIWHWSKYRFQRLFSLSHK